MIMKGLSNGEERAFVRGHSMGIHVVVVHIHCTKRNSR